MIKLIRKLMFFVACIICTLPLLSVKAGAYSPIEPDKTVSARLQFQCGEKSIPGAEFSIYRIADVSVLPEFTVCGEFRDYCGQLNGLKTASDWADRARELVAYIAVNKIQPLNTVKTDANGTAVFADSLKPGLYLFTCGETAYKGKVYTALPSLICMPNLDEKTSEWEYESVSVKVKAGDFRDTPPIPSVSPDPPKNSPLPSKLPQTGMLWWPVPVMLFLGLLLIAIASLKRRS